MTVGVKDQVTGTPSGDTWTMEVDGTWGGAQARDSYDPSLVVSVVGDNRSFDTYDGGNGFDTLQGTSGNDALFYDTSASTVHDANGTAVANAHMFTSIETFDMGAGNDVLDLTSGSGGTASYTTNVQALGGTGNDVLWTGGGSGTLVGDIPFLTGVGGADVLHGGAGNDILAGDAVVISGGQAGNDILDGGTGNDFLFGDGENLLGLTRGHNTFRFDGPGSGQDTIGNETLNGFRHGLDHIQLRPGYGYTTAAQALSHTADNGAGNAVVDLGHGDTITLFGVHTSQLDVSDFTIA